MKKTLLGLSIAVLATATFATSYDLEISTEVFPHGPASVIGRSSYCMANHVPPTPLVAGYVKLDLSTQSELFSYCGVRHSSEVIEIRNAEKKAVVVLEFYKPVGLSEDPYIMELSSEPNIKCEYFSSSSNLMVNCEKVSTTLKSSDQVAK